MSKIEKFLKVKSEHESMKLQIDRSLNRNESYDRSRDKHHLGISDSKWHDSGESMGYLRGYSGFYGSSGCTYECSPRLAKYLIIVINNNIEKLVDEAIKLSEEEVEKKRLQAEDEANAVLIAINPKKP